MPILEIDAAQYAEMSRELLQHDNWLHFYDNGRPYLDKPPFIFWISALSMKILGVSTWSYKLPSLLFAVGAIYALYRFTLLFYNKEIAHYTSLIFGSCQAMFLMTNDIKTDTILMSFVIIAFWQISAWLYANNKWGWLWGAVCIGGAMLTKGPIGLLVMGFGFLPHFILKKQWYYLWRWQYIVMALIIGLILLPMSIGLYTQFDLNPTKLVNGEYNVSGLRFYYWTQSFGRITGESIWENNVGFTFLYSNLLWGFIPFTVFFVAATFSGLLKLVKRPFQTEWISTSAVILAYISLGMSKFQLPHYIYVILPFLCLLTGRYYYNLKNYFGHKFRILSLVHNTLLFASTLALPFFIYWVFPTMSTYSIVGLIIIEMLFVGLIYSTASNYLSLLTATVLTAVVLNITLVTIFYPNLFPYQKEYTLANEIKKRAIPVNQLGKYEISVLRSADFILQHDIKTVRKTEVDSFDYLITNQKGLSFLSTKGNYSILFSGHGYHIPKLRFGFLNPATRKNFTEAYYLVKKKK